VTSLAPAVDATLLARRLAALEHGEIRARAAARALGAVDPAAAAFAIAALARDGALEARAALAAVAQALADPDPELPYAWRAELYAAARDAGQEEVAALVLSPPPLRAWSPPRDAADAHLAHLTLGHKKALARAQRDPDLLARLAAEGDPTVVAELLRNPGLTEPFVVRIAARRPCRPETLRCIFESRRWRTRPAIARAVARNPYAEPEIAVKLAATLPRADLAVLAADAAVHPLVRGLAERIARARRVG
jgi:DNA-directed RNA polymerase subunit F